VTSSLYKKLALVAVIAAVVGAFFAFDLGQYLTLDYLKSQQAEFRMYYRENPVLMLGAFFVIYVVVTALSLPGAAVMTLAGGALYGFLPALIVVSFASSIGATLACAAARFVLRGWVQGKFGERLAAINRGVEREGAFYLFTLRLVPIFPFFVINLVFGLTPMRLLTFYWVSQLGMLPGTAVYVNAGTQLGQIQKLGDVMSFEILGSFALLGLFPLIAKKTLVFFRKKAGKKPVPVAAANTDTNDTQG
jgi:uncharacterized membrane protein YdjX (TVP38/TMEM64 family)